MRWNRLSHGRAGVLTLGTMVALAACGGGDRENEMAAGDTSAAAATASGGALSDSAAAGTTGTAAGGAAGDMTNLSDANIMGLIGMSNATEISTSKAAQDKLTDANARAFARDMIREHQTMQKQADQVATKLNITPEPGTRGDQMQKMVDSATTALNAGTRGAELDRQFMTFQVQSHQMTLDNLQRFQNATQNAEVRNLIQQAIPKVQQHLQRARDIQGKMGAA